MTKRQWVRKFLTHDDFHSISEAIKAAEKSTSADMVPMIVKSSSTVGHIPILLFLLVFILMSFGQIFIQQDSWGKNLWYWPMSLLASAGLALTLSRLAFIQRIFTPLSDRYHHVMARAEIEFHRAGIDHTVGRNGVLIFVSLMERQVVILADKTVAAKLPAETWQKTIASFLKDLKKGRTADAFINAINQVGATLSEHFPSIEGRKSELSDRLIVKE